MSLNRPKQLQRTDKASPSTVCQKCTKRGHYTYQCTNSRPYVPRLSRTQRLEKDLKIGDSRRAGDGPLVELPDEFRSKKGLADKILKEREAQRKLDEQKKKSKSRKRRSSSSSSSSSSGSDSSSSSDSDSDSDSGSSSDSSSSRSDSPPPRKRRDKRGSSRSVSPLRRTRDSRDAKDDRRRSRSPARKGDRRDRSGSP